MDPNTILVEKRLGALSNEGIITKCSVTYNHPTVKANLETLKEDLEDAYKAELETLQENPDKGPSQSFVAYKDGKPFILVSMDDQVKARKGQGSESLVALASEACYNHSINN